MQTDTCGTNGESANWVDPATKVVEEVARAKDVDPLDIDPLTEVVNLDALSKLVRCSTGEVSIEFEYERHTITVRGDGDIHVE